ncbi:MAG: rod-binding protein [Alphaproteobacteria bacterium]|nr:rod-binding protein [Alphaproteobacteria bacterium]
MNINPNTSLALMQATQLQAQGQTEKAASNVKKALSDKDMQRFDEAAKDFEAMFVTEMMKPMFEQIKPDAMFGGGKGEEIFQGMMLQEYGKLMAETGQLGIANTVKAELIRMQSEADNGPVR